ncbi:membrane cofactor -like isoform X1 [Labeo rohita]|uniref:Membrane cofactor-like isoform X1 n=1 Tax=Labeo rohita TaxID=84645 RepID=A0A498N5G2_LABRO|nr:membrane cofactor -like isoform X1 [Labeo rohita]RXN26914.1 membrane cofactor -like isoform X1 [Labeo rohita]
MESKWVSSTYSSLCKKNRRMYKMKHFTEYKCDDGYTMKGEGYIVCKENGWSPEPPQCIAQCTQSSFGPRNVIVTADHLSTQSFADGVTVTIQCMVGYKPAGSKASKSVTSVKCPSPPSIENGQLVDVPLDYYDYSQAVSYRCNGGFDIIGQSTIHCSEDGTFKPDPPTCFDGCPAPIVPNAKRIGGRSRSYKRNHFIEYKCDDGYTMKGEGHIVCKENGWSPEPPQCIGPCNSPVLKEHVTLTQEFRSQKSFPHGSTVTVECIHGYKSDDSTESQSITCEETKWSKLHLTCIGDTEEERQGMCLFYGGYRYTQKRCKYRHVESTYHP